MKAGAPTDHAAAIACKPNIWHAGTTQEPIQEVEIHEQLVGLVRRRSIMRIIAKRMKAAWTGSKWRLEKSILRPKESYVLSKMDERKKPFADGSTEVASGSADTAYPQVERFWLLDNLRGLASLSVVVFHYQHFYFSAPGTLPSDFDRSSLPFSGFLRIFYNMGFSAVQLFFVLSGFVFFFVYYKSLCEQKVSGFQYFVARFSRLYPLHAATLLIVAFGQWMSIRVTGQFTVYPYNDFYHFVLQLFFASHWGLQLGDSFNGPVWSLSVEVVAYFIFYVYASQVATRSSEHLRNAVIAFGISLIIWRLSPRPFEEITHGVSCFFAGGLTFFAWKKIASLKTRERLYVLASIGIGGTLAVLLFMVTGLRPVLYFMIFPALVLFLAVAQALNFGAGKRSRFLGDISYSTYLLHFPLQLCIILVVTALGVSPDYGSPIIFVCFFAILLMVSAVAFYWFERPLQYYLRAKMLG